QRALQWLRCGFVPVDQALRAMLLKCVAKVQKFAHFRDAFAVHDVEFDLLEGRRHLENGRTFGPWREGWRG
ncbi:MAG: hypothetical protein AAFO97_17900, partial [Pseudomonadota bacterium]